MKSAIRKVLVALAILILAAVIFYFARSGVATAQVNNFYETSVDKPVLDLGSTARLEILPLYDESTRSDGLQWGHGVSYLVITDQASILMDVGYNPKNDAVPPLSQNMEALQVDIEDIDLLFISHPHPDHLGGMQMWQNKTFTLDNQATSLHDMPVFIPAPLTYPGVTPTLVSEPIEIAPGVATSGAMPFAEVYPMTFFQSANTEQSLVINVTGKGLVVITGCGHPTVERIVEQVEKRFGQPVIGILGGLHYEGMSAEQAAPHIRFLQARSPQIVALSPHDSSPEAIQAFQTAFADVYQEIHVGEMITFSR